MTNFLEQEQVVKQAVQQLSRLLSDLPQVQEFQQLAEKVAANQKIAQLEEAIKQAQKDAVQYQHYQKPEAHAQALVKADELTAQYNQLPLVVAYREKMLEVNDILQYVTDRIQRGVEDLTQTPPPTN